MAEEKKKASISITTQILIATFSGVAFGLVAGPWAGNLKFIGDIFIRLIQMTVIILVMTAVIGSVGGLEGKGLGRMGFNTMKWFIIFTVFAATTGLALGQIIQPGADINLIDPASITGPPSATGIQETILGFFSTNILSSMASGAMIPCIIFSMIFGTAIGNYRKANPNSTILKTITECNNVVMYVIQMVMKLAPIGVFCLLADVTGAVGFKIILPMIKYLGCLAIGTVFLMSIYIALAGLRCGVNPFLMIKKFAKMTLVALTTVSSAITLPTKMEDTVTKFGVSRRVSDFVGPLAMTMNSSGVAICNVVVICFLSQTSGVILTTYQMVMGIILSCMLCMGTITVPGGFIVTATFLSASLGLPPDSIALMLGVDWFAGMMRTVLNVDADVIVAMLVANVEGELDKEVYYGRQQIEYA